MELLFHGPFSFGGPLLWLWTDPVQSLQRSEGATHLELGPQRGGISPCQPQWTGGGPQFYGRTTGKDLPQRDGRQIVSEGPTQG